MGPNDPFSTQATGGPESPEATRPLLEDEERRRRIGTAIGAGVGLGFGVLVLLVGFWTALVVALAALLGAGLGRLIGARRALATSRRVIDVVMSRA